MRFWARIGACALVGGMVFSVLLEKWTLPGLLAGAAAGAAFAMAAHQAAPERPFPLRPGRLLPYLGHLLWSMASSTGGMLRLVMTRGELGIRVVREAPAVGDREKVLVANSITLTPGTITLEETDKAYTVLCARKGSENPGPVAESFERFFRKEEER